MLELLLSREDDGGLCGFSSSLELVEGADGLLTELDGEDGFVGVEGLVGFVGVVGLVGVVGVVGLVSRLGFLVGTGLFGLAVAGAGLGVGLAVTVGEGVGGHLEVIVGSPVSIDGVGQNSA